ncbi:MAG: YjfB family protein [Oscillospiraceae bacterium]|nr:YjfB family protein [Oscillospiraceae bacterium]
MEMEITSMAMSMAMSNVQNGLAVGMLKKTMDSSEQSMEAITEMLDSMPSPDGKGQLLDVRV